MKIWYELLNIIVNVLKFQTLFACQKGNNTHSTGPDQNAAESVWSESPLFAVLLSILWILGMIIPQFIWEQKEKSVQNFRTFTVYSIIIQLMKF